MYSYPALTVFFAFTIGYSLTTYIQLRVLLRLLSDCPAMTAATRYRYGRPMCGCLCPVMRSNDSSTRISRCFNRQCNFADNRMRVAASSMKKTDSQITIVWSRASDCVRALVFCNAVVVCTSRRQIVSKFNLPSLYNYKHR